MVYWKKKRAAIGNIHLDALLELDVVVVVMKDGQNCKDLDYSEETVVVVVVYACKEDETGVVDLKVEENV